ncbi:MAG TPA: DoxX family protein [Puia sp.]|jgi:hypothetical protein|nr:DoxX family protein [Puia sp.]
MQQKSTSKTKNNIAFWIVTTLLTLGMFSGGLGQLFRAKQTVEGFHHLGYPPYLLSILGTWKILGVIAILLPNFQLLKEWAYAGFFFAMSGAVVSHMASDDSFINYLAPLIFAILTVLSWWLRPANRKLSFG